MSKRVYFTKEEDEQLIDLIKSHPPLFNIKLKSYKNLTIKENIWEEIGKQMNKKVSDCKIRWKSLRDYFQRKKRDYKKATGSAASSTIDQRYESLIFLNSMAEERKTISSISVDEADSNLFEDEDVENRSINAEPSYYFDEEHLEVEFQCPSTNEDENPEESVITNCEKSIKKIPKPSSNKQEALYNEILKGRDERLNIMRQMVDNNNNKVEKDAVDLFFESIASTVKQMPALSIAKAKVEVLNVITNIEIEILHKQSSCTSTQYSSSPTPSDPDA